MEYENNTVRRECDCNHCEKDGCTGNCNVYTDITIPFEITPDAKLGKVELECCGEPLVKTEQTDCGTLRVTVTQKVIVNVPVCYEVKIK